MVKTLDGIKKIISDIDVLNETVDDLKDLHGDTIMKYMMSRLYSPDVELEPNTTVLIRESIDKMIQDTKKLIENEIGERMKKLNVHN